MPELTALIPLDGTKLSESAFALLPEIKALGFERVRLVSVWEKVWEDRETIIGRPEDEFDEVNEKGRNYVEAYVGQKAEVVRAAGFAVDVDVRSGRPDDEILHAAREHAADLIVIATHGRDGIDRWRLGSVADKVIRHATCPTLVIGPNVSVELAPFSLNRILVPLDGSALAEEALPLAAWIARKTNAEINLVRAVSLVAATYEPSMDVYPVDLLTAMEDAARRYLDRKAGELGAQVKTRTALFIGAAGEQILDYLKANPCGLVIMASHGRAGVARAALGSVTDRVLHGPAPVLVIQPEEMLRSRLIEAARTAG